MEQTIDVLVQKLRSGQKQYTQEAEAQFAQWENDNITAYLFSLVQYILNNTKDLESRFFVGVVFRGTLYSKDPVVNEQKQLRWIQTVPADMKAQIKNAMLGALESPEPRLRQIASQIISSIALVELPHNLWPELVPLLSNKVTVDPNPATQQACLQSIGYICESIQPEILEAHSSAILTAIIHGMRPEMTNLEVKSAACEALYNALSFCRRHFEAPQERSIIINVVVECGKSQNEKIAVASFSILAELASLHYDRIATEMENIFKLTLDAIVKGTPENVVKQAIEFWTTICDEELQITEEIQYALDCGLPAPRKHLYYIKGAVKFLAAPISNLLRTEEEVDADECSVKMAASICLTRMAQTVGDDIVQYVAPFITSNIGNADWKIREAAALAFGSILDGPKAGIAAMIKDGTPFLLNLMKDPKTGLKDTTAWTLGSIIKFHPEEAAVYSEDILKAMGTALGDKPRVASNAAWAILNIADAYQDNPSSPLIRYFNDVIQLLLVTADREDADENNLRVSAYEALNEVLHTAPKSLLNSLEQLVNSIGERLLKSTQFQCLTQDDVNKQNEIQSLLCGVLQILARKLEKKILPVAPQLMALLLNLLKAKRDSALTEEVFLTISALVSILGTDFAKYMEEFTVYLYHALDNWQEYQVCKVAIGLVGDISSALGLAIVPYCDKIITSLLHNLQNKQLDRAVKPAILSCLGDIAYSIGASFEKYCEVVMNMLKQATETVVRTNKGSEDYDLIDYMNSLREGILDAFTGICQAMMGARRSEVLLSHVPAIMSLVRHISDDPHVSDSVAISACALCGDLAKGLGSRIKNQIQQQFVLQLINSVLKINEEQATETAEWAKSVIASL
eukprot:TRINITY_DN1180_c0_g1_i2.p1 TRINITY_DN1180_c0_g1~~TRINITY_DN1180_c0_g1_i2.p1  ORF type:complete len:856 (+),score=219.61 TRINITY_DN1180_c0_g1_i2:38-2605(+)